MALNHIQPGADWYWEVTAVCPENVFEMLSFYLFENGASGIEELGQEDQNLNLRFFFPSSVSDPETVLKATLEQMDIPSQSNLCLTSVEKKPVQNWQEGWRDFFKPIEIGDHFLIRPPWESRLPDKYEIVIHPGQGFGTGYHESTHLALLLIEWLQQIQSLSLVCDIGTGSGILAIAVLLLGAEHVYAVDLEQEALLEVPNNLILSGLNESAVTRIQGGPEVLQVQTDLVMANIEGHILETMVDDLVRLTETGGYLILSGILTERENLLLEKLEGWFDLEKTLRMNEWSGFVLKKRQVRLNA